MSIESIDTSESVTSAAQPTASSSSLPAEAQKEAVNVKLYMQSAFALLIGIVPFAIAKIGEGIMKGSAFVTKHVRDFTKQLGTFGFITEIFFRVLVGIPTAIGGALFTAGAMIFSKSQALAWGQQLVEHPQEEKTNTKLARYGAGTKPWNDFKALAETYFRLRSKAPSKEGEAYKPGFDIDENLTRIKDFEAT